jgi:vacuolar-type H+-ATPase subunit F/Vma7
MIVDGIAELAGVEEAAEYRAESVRAREHEQERRRAEQIQFTILAERDIESLRKATRNARKD